MDGRRIGRCVALHDDYRSFEIGFSRKKENGGEIEFRERFQWSSPAVKVGLDFSSDEAVEHYWIDSVQACPCAR